MSDTPGDWTQDIERNENLSWINERHENEVKVSKFEDGTWDTWRNDRLVENYDTRDEAVSRAKKIMKNGEKPE
ncbi:MAG: hypothetical protein ABEJ99_01630 [Candidatus Nanohaloarchaea archaeon]